MFNKVLIANRGAIATRIIRTLKRLNITAVAVYAECDVNSLHVQQADEAYSLGDGAAIDTYLDSQKILSIAIDCNADAIHPGYGFLSENACFVTTCDMAGIRFIGPTADQITCFGLKHEARALAHAANVPLLSGSGLLTNLEQAMRQAQHMGYPVMLKSTAGGGGIGMQLCHDETALAEAFDRVKRLGANHFANDDVFIEKYIEHARHIEVQVLGDGQGQTLAIGERDCSAQRRNQKVIEECPAPQLSDDTRQQLYACAEELLSSVNYRNAGTVEFIFDVKTQQYYFLEVNTRLQVEHGVTEKVYAIDLVEYMLRLAAAESLILDKLRLGLQHRRQGHAIQTRIYAEDPYKAFQPSAGLLSEVVFPEGEHIRIDHWLESGLDIPVYFDPMLAKVIVWGESRDQALQRLQTTLAAIRLYGIQTNLDYLQQLCTDPEIVAGKVRTRSLNQFDYRPARIDVIKGGTLTTIQDYPARAGYWHVGVPPSGAFDALSFQLANRLLGNSPACSGLEITLQGPVLQFSKATAIVLTGADIVAHLDKQPVPMWTLVSVKAGQVLTLGKVQQTGARCYLGVAGGINCPDYLGSKSTFTLGQFGGHNGRALRTGDVLSLNIASSDPASMQVPSGKSLANHLRPQITHNWTLHVVYGPHGAPDFFTEQDIATFFNTDWEVHYNSSRTGIRLLGPKPTWARTDGGEAGMHPSNIHDNAYAFGTVDFTGDMPIILGPDGPSLGGFVCPATVIHADLWKLGQLRAGDTIRFCSVSLDAAVELEKQQQHYLDTLNALPAKPVTSPATTCLLDRLAAEQYGDEVVYRVAGDHFLLVEYGEQQLDIRLRFRAHALMQWLEQHRLAGIRELTPGIRSLQIHYDSQQLTAVTLVAHLKQAEQSLSTELSQLSVPSRIVHLPLSWDDEACQVAIQKYQQSVRSNAPWCPSNLEFIRRINGLPDIEAVKQLVFDAHYLVMGLGDVYLGAPVATPLDPRQRLVTTKYNPARTWTAENSVGIGGSYLCVYGMEGPGGYQFVGRTLQMWNRYKRTEAFEQPWLLRFFDQIRFYEVSHAELQQIRRDFPQGRYPLTIEKSEFSLTNYQQFIQQHQTSIESFVQHRNQAFEDELAYWHATGQFNFEHHENHQTQSNDIDWPAHYEVIESPVPGSVWQLLTTVDAVVNSGENLLILESMKMEIAIEAPCQGTIKQVLSPVDTQVNTGQALIIMEPHT